MKKKKILPSFLQFQVTIDNINQISRSLSWKQFGNNYLWSKMLGLWYCGSDNNKRNETNSNIVSAIINSCWLKVQNITQVLPHIWNNFFGSSLQNQLLADDELYVSQNYIIIIYCITVVKEKRINPVSHNKSLRFPSLVKSHQNINSSFKYITIIPWARVGYEVIK